MPTLPRSLVVFLFAWAAVAVAVFLVAGGFFSRWEGAVVSARPPPEDASLIQVLVVAPDGTRSQRWWPRQALDGLDVRLDPLALTPAELPSDLATTRKQPMSLTFSVSAGEGDGERVVSTATPGSLAIALLTFLVGVPLRNMVVAGSPLALTAPPDAPRSRTASPTAPPAPSDDAPSRARGRKGPPPPRRQRGVGRRR